MSRGGGNATQCRNDVGNMGKSKYRVIVYWHWLALGTQNEPSRQFVERQRKQQKHIRDARELLVVQRSHRGGTVSRKSRSLRSKKRRTGVTTTHELVNSHDLTVNMRVRLFYEGRGMVKDGDIKIKNIGVQLSLCHYILVETQADKICFCMAGLRAPTYKTSYFVRIKLTDVKRHTVCLTHCLV